MTIQRKSALTILLLVLLIPFSASCEESISIRPRSVWGGIKLSEGELLRFLPDELKTRTELGVVRNNYDFDVSIYPAKDSAGLSFDTLSANPDYLFVVYGTTESILVVLKRSGSGYIEHFRSAQLIGSGEVNLKDLDGDGKQDIIVSLQSGTHGQQNIFICSWNDGDIRVLNPSGRFEGMSEFGTRVEWETTDSGLAIKAWIPWDTLMRHYFWEKGSDEIKPVKQERKERTMRHW